MPEEIRVAELSSLGVAKINQSCIDMPHGNTVGVYGTLKKGKRMALDDPYWVHQFFPPIEPIFICDAEVYGQLWGHRIRDFPALSGGNSRVQVELWRVPRQLYLYLDGMERSANYHVTTVSDGPVHWNMWAIEEDYLKASGWNRIPEWPQVQNFELTGKEANAET